MIRNPVVAGQFYPSAAEALRETLADLTDAKAEKEAAVGLLMPHAGYIYSGRVAGAAISRVKFKDTFIIIGPSHTFSVSMNQSKMCSLLVLRVIDQPNPAYVMSQEFTCWFR